MSRINFESTKITVMNLLHFVREMRDKIVNGNGESEPVQWGDIENKPTEFTPEAHTHLWADITDKLTEFTPTSHTHSISDINGLEDRLTSIEQRLEALEIVEE